MVGINSFQLQAPVVADNIDMVSAIRDALAVEQHGRFSVVVGQGQLQGERLERIARVKTLPPT